MVGMKEIRNYNQIAISTEFLNDSGDNGYYG